MMVNVELGVAVNSGELQFKLMLERIEDPSYCHSSGQGQSI